jgi:phosphoenolpyruvate-protein kinase (PTS system EI component)
VRSIRYDDELVLDTTASPASLWVAPSAEIVSAARAWRDAWTHRRAEEEAEVAAPLTHLPVNVHINVGSLDERIPSSVEGIGLVRTELVFSDRTSAPGEAEQFGAIRALAARVGDVSLTVRLFDAGGDKPLRWLDGNARGIELLLAHPAILDAQLRALSRAGQHASVRVMVPLVANAEQVERVRARSVGLPVGAMIETPEAVGRIDEIAAVSDFISIGTNDLSAALTGQRRANSTLSTDPRLLMMVSSIVEASHARGLAVSVCGEMAGEPHGARLLVGLGVDTLSVATARLANVKLSLRDVTLEDCRRVLQKTLE